jgi:hypothetical protein
MLHWQLLCERGVALFSGVAGTRRLTLLRSFVAEALGTCTGVVRHAGTDAARRGAGRVGYGAVPGIDVEALADALLSLSLPLLAHRDSDEPDID